MVHDELNFIACKKNNYCVRNSENLKNTTKYVRIRMLSKKLDGASLIPDLGPKWVRLVGLNRTNLKLFSGQISTK